MRLQSDVRRLPSQLPFYGDHLAPNKKVTLLDELWLAATMLLYKAMGACYKMLEPFATVSAIIGRLFWLIPTSLSPETVDKCSPLRVI